MKHFWKPALLLTAALAAFAVTAQLGTAAPPKAVFTVEPAEGTSMGYLPVAAKTSKSAATAQLSMRLSIQNDEAKTLHLTKVMLSFSGGPAVSPVSIAASQDVGSKKTGIWNNTNKENVILPYPPPKTVTLSLYFTGYADPVKVTKTLAAHKSPTPSGSYAFPGKASDLRPGEFWSGSTGHGTGNQGSQLYAYDLGVIAYDEVAKKWSGTLPGTTGTKNEDSRIWGKPVHALADGKVISFLNNHPTNPKPGEQVKPLPHGAGNHFYMQHGDEVVLYAHMQPGSLNKKLLASGAVVKAGDFLGLAGNSGSSSGPHLHIHAIKGTKAETGPLRPLPFHGIQVIERAALNSPAVDGPWVKVNGQGLPASSNAVWPADSKPSLYPPGMAEVAKHGVPAASYQKVFDEITQAGYRPVWVDGYDVSGKTFFNVIFRPANGVKWEAHHGMTAAKYQAEFDAQKKDGFRLLHVDSYLEGGSVRYAAVWMKGGGPAQNAYHGKTVAEHQKLFDDLTKDGWRPQIVSVVSVSGERYHTALYTKEDVGSYWTKNFMTAAEYQKEYDSDAKAGRKLVYLNAYTHQGQPRFTAVWHSKVPGTVVAHHGMSSAQYQAEFNQQLAQGRLTRTVTGYDVGGVAFFAASWRK